MPNGFQSLLSKNVKEEKGGKETRKVRIPTIVCLVAILLSSLVTFASAHGIVDDDVGTILSQTVQGQNGRYRVALVPEPAELHVGPNMNLLRTEFPDWTFEFGWGGIAQDAPGDMHIIQYDAYVGEPDDPTGVFTVDYISGAGGPGLPAGWVLQWIQFITTTNAPNFPEPGNPNPFIDPTMWRGNRNFEDGLPFYWNETERIRYSAGGANCPAGVDIRFRDRPRMVLSRATAANPVVTFEADLYLVSWDQHTTVYIPSHGIRWGFTITRVGAGAGGGGELSYGGVGGNAKFYKDDCFNGTVDYGYLASPSVGGIVDPVDKLVLLAPYIGLASTILVATVATAVYVKRVKRRKEKQ